MAIVDQYGNPVVTGGRQYKYLMASEQTMDRPSWALRYDDPLEKLVNFRDWKTVSFISSRLYANLGIPRGAIAQKAMYSVGQHWQPRFQGQDKEWGDKATKWLTEIWYQMSDVRGAMFDFRTRLYMDSVAIDRDGDHFVLLTESDDGRFPMVQRIPARRVGMRGNSSETVTIPDGQAFAGFKMRQGIVYNSYGRPVGYNLLSDDPAFDRIVPSSQMFHVYDPEYYDQDRGFPAFTFCLDDLRDAIQSQKWEQLTMLLSSSLSFVETNESGTAPVDDIIAGLTGEAATTTPGGLNIQQYEGGMIRYFSANSGSKIEQHQNHRPGDEWEQFQDRIIRNALAGINWSYALMWKSDGANGTITRAHLEQARCSVADRQSILGYTARREVQYAVSKAIKSGILPPYRGDDIGGFLKWTFQMPPKISIDPGRDSDSMRKDFQLGWINTSDYLDFIGKDLESHYRQRAYEIATRKRIQEEVEMETGIHIDDREMIMFTPNDQPDPEESESQDDMDGSSDKLNDSDENNDENL